MMMLSEYVARIETGKLKPAVDSIREASYFGMWAERAASVQRVSIFHVPKTKFITAVSKYSYCMSKRKASINGKLD
jgi:hypothetical protein